MLPPEDVIRQAGNGIYVEDVSNGQVKIGEGDFAFYVSQGRMIENGKLTAPIKDVNIMGNGPKMLANITMAANDLEMSHGRCRTVRQERAGCSGVIRTAYLPGQITYRRWYTTERRPVMTNIKNKQMSFPELADWVISRTMKAGAGDCRVKYFQRDDSWR